MSAHLTTLVLVRHGETPANLDGVWHGSTDTPLTERGHAQADRVADYITTKHGGASALYSSDLQRARNTARPISAALGLDIRFDADLREYDLGAWEGKSYRELHEQHGLWRQMREDPHFAPHGGESPLQVTERFTAALHRIAASHAGELVVVVTHGGALSLGFGALIDGDFRRWHHVMDNCAVSELTLSPSPSLRSFNLTEHLAGV